MENEIKDRVVGVILGEAIGDALGSQTEFAHHHQVSDLGATWGLSIPAFSDDTQMMLAIAEAFASGTMPVKHNIASIDTFMNAVSRNFVRWDDGAWGGNFRSPGGTCMGGVRSLRRGEDWRSSGSTDGGKGNGGAMRVSVVGAALHIDPFFAYQIGALTSVPTHNNVESLIACGILSSIIADSIHGVGFEAAVVEAIRTATMYDTNMLRVTHCQDENPQWAIGHLLTAYEMGVSGQPMLQFRKWNGNDGKGVEAVAAALYLNAVYESHEEIVVHAANETGDSDSVAAIAGAIAGARFGVSDIRPDWRKRVEESEYLHDLGNRIYQLNSTPEQAQTAS